MAVSVAANLVACCQPIAVDGGSPHHGSPRALAKCLGSSPPCKCAHLLLRASREQLEALVDFEKASPSCEEHRQRVGRDMICDLFAADVPASLVKRLDELDFEGRKEVARFFDVMHRHAIFFGLECVVVEYLQKRPWVVKLLIEGCSRPEVAHHFGSMLRTYVRHPELAWVLLDSGAAVELMDLVSHQDLDVSSDAFSSLRAVLLTHTAVAASYVGAHFDDFFRRLGVLTQSSSYLVQRQALRLLAEMLMDEVFMATMLTYVRKVEFLQIQMNLLLSKSKAIQADAFHVFKIFVAHVKNRSKVHRVLYRNRLRLAKLLQSMNSEGGVEHIRAEELQAAALLLLTLEPPLEAICPSPQERAIE